MTVDTPGQTILDRTAVVLTPDALEARFTIALPASGRTVLGQMAYRCLIDMLPQYVQQVKITESHYTKFILLSQNTCIRAYFTNLSTR